MRLFSESARLPKKCTKHPKSTHLSVPLGGAGNYIFQWDNEINYGLVILQCHQTRRATGKFLIKMKVLMQNTWNYMGDALQETNKLGSIMFFNTFILFVKRSQRCNHHGPLNNTRLIYVCLWQMINMKEHERAIAASVATFRISETRNSLLRGISGEIQRP
jgi:hypothetical protein